MVLSVEAKWIQSHFWEALTDNGRERTGINLLDWVVKAENYGAGEILLTSVDKDGTKKGFDTDLVKQVSERVNIPIVVSGGMQHPNNIADLCHITKVDSYAIASLLHYEDFTIRDIKNHLKNKKLPVRLNEKE